MGKSQYRGKLFRDGSEDNTGVVSGLQVIIHFDGYGSNELFFVCACAGAEL